jgi:hypothetical protein
LLTVSCSELLLPAVAIAAIDQKPPNGGVVQMEPEHSAMLVVSVSTPMVEGIIHRHANALVDFAKISRKNQKNGVTATS